MVSGADVSILVFMSLGLDTLFEQMYTIWKCCVPQWNVSNCFLSKNINAICTCIYVNNIKAAGVLTKCNVMLWNIFAWLIGVSERLCCQMATLTLIHARADYLISSLLFKQVELWLFQTTKILITSFTNKSIPNSSIASQDRKLTSIITSTW